MPTTPLLLEGGHDPSVPGMAAATCYEVTCLPPPSEMPGGWGPFHTGSSCTASRLGGLGLRVCGLVSYSMKAVNVLITLTYPGWKQTNLRCNYFNH